MSGRKKFLLICMLAKTCQNFGCYHIIPHERIHRKCGARECEFMNNGKLVICTTSGELVNESIVSIWEE